MKDCPHINLYGKCLLHKKKCKQVFDCDKKVS